MKLWLKHIFIIIFCLFLLFCAGCSSSSDHDSLNQTVVPTDPEVTEPVIEFTIATKSFAERYGEYYDSKRSFTTTVNGITYHFDVSIKEEERLEIIAESERLVSALLEPFPDYSSDLTLCFRPGDYPARALDHTLYIGTDHLKTQSYAVGTAVAVFGHDVNYGILFAHGTQTGQALRYAVSVSELSAPEALSLYDTNPEYLDLNYACFLDVYTPQDIMEKVESVSLLFYDFLLEHQYHNLFTDYSDMRYSVYCTEFLQENGKGAYSNMDLEDTIFYFGGPKIRLIWENADGVFYVEDAFQTQYEMPHLQDRLNTDYATLRQTIVDYLHQADRMESIVGMYESDSTERIDVVFTAGHATDRYSLANYSYSENLIRMFCAEPFLHEYGHYLLRETGIDSWLNELICYYYGYYPTKRPVSYMWQSEVNRQEAATDVEAAFLQALKHRRKDKVDLSDPDDFVYIFSGYQALYGNYDVLLNPDSGAEAKVSFMHYLVGIAGEEAAVQAIVAEDPVPTFGKDWPELIADWSRQLQEEYQWITEYFYINGG